MGYHKMGTGFMGEALLAGRRKDAKHFVSKLLVLAHQL
jgi:hypothetical protein